MGRLCAKRGTDRTAGPAVWVSMYSDFVGGPFRASGRIFFDANSYALKVVPFIHGGGADHTSSGPFIKESDVFGNGTLR